VNPAVRPSDRKPGRVASSALGARLDFVLRPGWCLMQTRFLVLARPRCQARDTRFAGLAALRLPDARLDLALPPSLMPCRGAYHRADASQAGVPVRQARRWPSARAIQRHNTHYGAARKDHTDP